MAEPAVKKKHNEGWNGPEGSRNTKGRPKTDRDTETKRVSRREQKSKELLQLARKLRPHISTAIGETVKILSKNDAADTTKLRAAAFLVGEYHKLVEDIYEGEDTENELQDVQPKVDDRPVFSLRMINTNTEEKSSE